MLLAESVGHYILNDLSDKSISELALAFLIGFLQGLFPDLSLLSANHMRYLTVNFCSVLCVIDKVGMARRRGIIGYSFECEVEDRPVRIF